MIKETEYYVHAKFLHRAASEVINFDGKTALNQPTGHFFYDPWVIKDEYRNSIWETILNTLEFSYGEARLIVLQPGETYMAHADIDDRYHLNITGNNSFLIDISKQKMYSTIADGKWYEMDAGKIHSATNYGEVPRAQLVVRKLLKKGRFDKHVHVTISPSQHFHDYRYRFDNQISPWLNQINSLKKMDNFQYYGNRVEFDMDAECVPELNGFNRSIFNIVYE